MNVKDFNEVIHRRLDLVEDTLSKKGLEYSTETDKMHNFNQGAAFTGKIREEVLLGFALKHWISIMDIIENLKQNKLPTRELLDEKIGDWVNYMCLLEVSIVDKINNYEKLD